MILLLNSKLTSHRLGSPMGCYRQHEASHYKKFQFDRFDIFRYFLASRAAMNEIVSKYVFFIEIADEYKNRLEELEEYIYGLFPKEKLILNWYRAFTANDWVKIYHDVLEQIDDDIIWYDGCDDHIFIDSNLDTLKNGIELLKKDDDPYAVIYYSHWPEQLKIAEKYNAEYIGNYGYLKYRWCNYDAIQVYKKERYKKYFLYSNLGEREVFRTDSLVGHGFYLESNFYVPTKEMVRHFDGYGHIGDIINLFPSLIIPTNFFEKQLKIKYGYNERKDLFYNINPCSDTLYAQSISGTDSRWALEDIPLFWKDRISEIDVNKNIDLDFLKQCRNKWLVKSTKININAFNFDYIETYDKELWFKYYFL